MIVRTFDPILVNAVSNHPSILPYIRAGRDSLDMSTHINDHRNVFLAGEHGIVVFEYLRPKIYSGHPRILPSGRGKWCLGFIFAATKMMFDDGAEILYAMVPRGYIASRALVCHMGMQYEFTLEKGWVNPQGERIPASVYALSRERWERLNA